MLLFSTEGGHVCKLEQFVGLFIERPRCACSSSSAKGGERRRECRVNILGDFKRGVLRPSGF